jgi:hypothetical protein
MSDREQQQQELRVPTGYPVEPPSGFHIGSIVGATVTVIGALLWLRRRTSRDGLEIAKDRAEINTVAMLQNERNKAMEEAREAWRRRTEDAETIARLTGEVQHLSQKSALLEERVTTLTKLVFQFAPPEMRLLLNGVHALGEQQT